MDNSLKSLEKKLEGLTPRGMSDSGLDRCQSLIEELANGQDSVRATPAGLSWKVSGIAALLVLAVGLASGWWLGKEQLTPFARTQPRPLGDFTVFELIDERSWQQFDEGADIILTSTGKIKEVGTALGISEETVYHRESGQYVTVRVTTRHPVERETNQF